MLDSLVRVSRRVGWDPTSTLRSGPQRRYVRENAFREETGHDRASTAGRRRARRGAETPKLANERPV